MHIASLVSRCSLRNASFRTIFRRKIMGCLTAVFQGLPPSLRLARQPHPPLPGARTPAATDGHPNRRGPVWPLLSQRGPSPCPPESPPCAVHVPPPASPHAPCAAQLQHSHHLPHTDPPPVCCRRLSRHQQLPELRHVPAVAHQDSPVPVLCCIALTGASDRLVLRWWMMTESYCLLSEKVSYRLTTSL